MALPILNDDLMYQAFLHRDREFEGLFYAGVLTTGVFCRPTCTARKPKRENVAFFRTTREAILAGFRACRICRPLETPGEAPAEIRGLLAQLAAEPDRRLRDAELRAMGLDPERARRWFKKHHGMTFQAYQRLARLNRAIALLQADGSVTEAAFGAGYESLSGFGAAVRSATRGSPRESRDKNLVTVERLATPLGPIFAAATAAGLCLLEFTDRKMLETEFADLARRLDAVILPGTNALLREVQRQLDAYFARRLRRFDLPLDLVGTDFQRRVWAVLQTIPYGETRSYRDQALSLGDAKMVRAVARANGMNKIAIVVPCHRVIAENGDLLGYGGGIWRKKWLLDLERGRGTGDAGRA